MRVALINAVEKILGLFRGVVRGNVGINVCKIVVRVLGQQHFEAH